jgi:carboxyl-terminal processing protease
MKPRYLVVTLAALLAAGRLLVAQGMNANEQQRVQVMLKQAYDTVKRNYYDPTLHGVDWDARFHEYEQKVKAAGSLNDGLTMVAAFLDGLKDTHTYFGPPSRPYRFDYGYRLGTIGNAVYVTHVRPETDAVSKVHPGDQVLAINGGPVTRDTLPTAEYVLNTLSPQPATRLTLKDPNGDVREVGVTTKVVPGRALRDLSGTGADMEFADLVREQEASDYFLRQQYVELGDVMIWKMPLFDLENGGVDKMFGIARKHAALVLDLRDNPGGAVDTLLRMIGNLFDHNVVVGDRVTRKGRSRLSAKGRGGDAFTGKLVVLVNGQSGSSSEILARIVQLEHRGIVVGDRSAGAVMEARGFPYFQGDDVVIVYGFSVTDADLVMTDGKSLEHAGVTPDEVVLPTAADVVNERDPALVRAAALAGAALAPAQAGKLFPVEWRPFKD